MKNNLTIKYPELQKKLVKYLLFGLIIAISIRYIPTNEVNNKEIAMISAIASISFGILDMISPSIIINN